MNIKETIKAHNKAVHIMDDWMRDPYIVLGPDNKYYLTATQFNNEAKGLGFPMWRSDDLAEWEYLGIKYTLKDTSFYEKFVQAHENMKLSVELRLWAPELYYKNNRWIVVHTTNSRISSIALSEAGSNIFKTPITDWGTDFGHRHDPSLFLDDDSNWLVCFSDKLQKIKYDFSGYEGELLTIGPSNRKLGHEGCQIVKIGKKYVLFGTAWSTDKMRQGTYNLYYCTADNITGPYDERKFVGRCLGHGTVFMDKEGRYWCTAFYNGEIYMEPEKLAQTDIKLKEDGTLPAVTINKQGLTLVPLEVNINEDGNLTIKSTDPSYEKPGSEEIQKFS